jgi:hypothetical protein
MDETFIKYFPSAWKDPLELCGSFFRYLIEESRDLDQHREFLREIVRKYGADWVWKNRSRLVALMVSLFTTPSMD